MKIELCISAGKKRVINIKSQNTNENTRKQQLKRYTGLLQEIALWAWLEHVQKVHALMSDSAWEQESREPKEIKMFK